MKVLSYLINYLLLCIIVACALTLGAIVTHYGVTIIYGRDLLAAYNSTKSIVGIAIALLWGLVFLRAWLFDPKR